jgi:CheY-like chemotaxis protein
VGEGALNGLRVLIVEDDAIIALDVANTLAGAGAAIVGPAHTVAGALALLERARVDAAVLDYRLERETASPVAHWLAGAGIPFLFYSSSNAGPALAHPGVPILAKPTDAGRLVTALRALTSEG